MTNIPDLQQRQLALDATQSFIVQAPAGSGKTELLIQRLLVLLGQVKEPEEVLAITFTRKAAAEMADRIILALQRATLEPEPTTEPARKTWQLAQLVLQRDKTYNWQLLTNPHRLRIQTIDAFCASIARQMPILAQLGPQPQIAEDAYLLYQKAVRQFMATLDSEESWANALANILSHLDNQYSSLERLLINMLAKRDQWLPHLTHVNNIHQLRETLEAELSNIVEEKLQHVRQQFDSAELISLNQLVQYACQQFHAHQLKSPLLCCDDYQEPPPFNSNYYEHWQAIAQFLVTQKYEWRKKVTVREGFPAVDKSLSQSENALRKAMKEQYSSLLAKLSTNELLRQALQAICQAPPRQFSDGQWEVLTSLIHVLKIVAGFLWLSFQEHNAVDYVEITQRALQALGEAGEPSQLALLLDYKIQHILVDEFQDTSSTQYRLLEKLTEGWEAHDGRTLFLVGDPMQSIYRFRKAEVGLFLQAELYGINQIKLHKLNLTSNFRSQTALVTWFNEAFSNIFPAKADIGLGAIPYTRALGVLPSSHSPAVQTHLFTDDPAAEIQCIINLIQQQLAADTSTKIAILVRARQHIAELTPALQAANIPYRAVEIEALKEKTVIHDLLILTRALLFLDDRIAWLAMLRAPWCALNNDDLYQIAGSEHTLPIWERMQTIEQLNLTSAGYEQVKRMLTVLSPAITHRQRKPLELWLESIWLQLGGPVFAKNANELQDAQTFFKLISQLHQGNHITDISLLEQKLTELYAAPSVDHNCRLEIMTIHKAKGLEFDTVILPCLHKESAIDKSQLLLFMETSGANNKTGLILAPIKAFIEHSDPIYRFIQQEEKQKADYELSRLLYVAVTRAKRHLHLLGQVNFDRKLNTHKLPAKASLLGKLWPYIDFQITTSSTPSSAIEANSVNRTKTQLLRLAINYPLGLAPLVRPVHKSYLANPLQTTRYQIRQETLKQVGTILHRLLCRMSQMQANTWPNLLKEQSYWETALTQLGVIPNELAFAITTIHNALANTMKDERAKWILAQDHPHAQSEYPISFTQSAAAKQLIVDRTFIADNTRWIIDYKTTLYLARDLMEQQQQHREQLETYAHVFQQMESRPIRLGLYFPLLPDWIEWTYIN